MDNHNPPPLLKSMALDADTIIAGGGLNGTALALALANSGLSVILVDPVPNEQRKDAKFDGRSYALALTSQRLLKAIGVWDSISEHSQPILEIKVSEGLARQGASPFVLEFDHAEIEEGPMGFMMEDRYLRGALLDAIAVHPNITHLAKDTVTSHDASLGYVEVGLESGKKLRAQIILGCDGKTSQTAQRSGIKRVGWGYNQSALVCSVSHERPHDGTAHQFFMPSGPLAILPLPGYQSSIVWTETTSEANRIQSLNDTDYLAVLRPRFGDFLGEINLAGKRFSYPLGMSIAESFIADRVALIGDAAHSVHPIAGQGLNAGIKDIAALAEVLVAAKRRGEDIGRPEVLERYQTWRRFDAATLAIATDAVNRLFSNDDQLLSIGRNIGVGLVNALPSLRRNLIREFAGLSGDLPKLLQGRSL